jgi:multidrug efflux system membrane fusion protein
VHRISGDEVVVDQGLQKDEQVVTDGQVRLNDGTKVEIVQDAEKAQPQEPKAASQGAGS